MSTAPSNGNGTTARWSLVLGAALFLLTLMGGIITFIIQVNQAANQAAMNATETANLKASYSIIIERLGAIRTEQAGIQRDLVEIGTMFCAEDGMRNLTHASDLRLMAMLWQKSMGAELPVSNAYYPKVGKCGTEVR